jgi:hypothetical protein
MSEILAYCGLVCHTCLIYLATRQENKDEQKKMRIEIVRVCKEKYNLIFQLEDITDCDGCLTEGIRLFSACATCPIRNCARGKNLANCAYCPNYTCKLLETFFAKEPASKQTLEKIRMEKPL